MDGEREILERMRTVFSEKFGGGGEIRAYFAPGRVNLIGEHTDYNGGHVFPCALQLGSYALVRAREDDRLRFYSDNLREEGVVAGRLHVFSPKEDRSWTAYMKGVMWTLEKHGFIMTHGLDILIYGDIPSGSGLSSSASLEVLTGFLLRDQFGFLFSNTELAKFGQESENQYNGMKCGIMDQFASAMGKKDHAVFLDTGNLSYEYAPLRMKGCRLMATNTNKQHKLVGSAYNDRRRECDEALQELKRYKKIQSLGELSDEDFAALESKLSSDILRKRARHAVRENNRTLRAVEALKQGRPDVFAALMWKSHESLRYDFEVSCEELDCLVELAGTVPGVLGSRMTGGGFGGCTVSVVRTEALPLFEKTLAEGYERKIGYPCSFYPIEAGDGPRRLISGDF